MSKIEIKVLDAPLAASLVGDFYSLEGNGIVIGDGDVFFVGFLQGQVVGSVRFCVEFGTAMLRTMRIAKRFQGLGYGRQLLASFESYLDREGVLHTYCLPYAHLERFYAGIGFAKIADSQAPAFLQERMTSYRRKSMDVVCMCRHGRQAQG